MYAEEYVQAEQAAEFSDPEQWRAAGEPYRRDILRALRRHDIEGPILDVGAGWGFLCDLLRREGYDCRGVELSAEMASWAQDHGHPVRRGGLDDDLEPASALVLCAVFEHLSDQTRWLDQFAARIPPGGWLVTLHPVPGLYRALANLLRAGRRDRELPEFHGTFAPPWHTALISPKGLHAAADRTGWAVRSIEPASTGRAGGLIGVAQRFLSLLIRLSKGRLATTHVCVLQRT